MRHQHPVGRPSCLRGGTIFLQFYPGRVGKVRKGLNLLSLKASADSSQPTSPLNQQPLSETVERSPGELPTQRVTSPTPPGVVKIFRWPTCCSGEEVYVAGSFSNWEPLGLRRLEPGGDLTRAGMLEPGVHQYKFLVDGRWRTSPFDPITRDEKGIFNNTCHIHPTATFSWFPGAKFAKQVYLAGSMTSWKELLPMHRDFENGGFKLGFCLEPGQYFYQFLVDGKWEGMPSMPIASDEGNHVCNVENVTYSGMYRIFYFTGWETPAVQYRCRKENGSPVSQEFTEVKMMGTKSRMSNTGGCWYVGEVWPDENAGTNNLGVDFYITNGEGQEDRPSPRGLYKCSVPGGYKLQAGKLSPYGRGMKGPIMVVSDLDGTMVENESAEADRAAWEFTNYWENNAALSASVLVYNTGRSLGQVSYMLQEKMGVLAIPDVVITAVGTKIFHLLSGDMGRSSCPGTEWQEDLMWSSILDEGWDLDAVRSVAQQLIDQRSDALNWLDYGTEHPHRIALSAHVDSVDYAVEGLKRGCDAKDVQVQVINSGTGSWRYVDCVPLNGGKLTALEYVRKVYNVPLERCVSAGDSCNDILMLQGDNPAVIVGNAQDELKKWLLQQPQQDRIVLADAPLARGIMEGLSRHGLY